MFLAVEVENGDIIMKNRFLGFFIWESIHSIAIFLLCKSLLLSPFTRSPLTYFFLGFATFIAFHLSLIFFFTAIAVVASPHPDRGASLWELALGIVKLVFVLGGVPMATDFHRRMKILLSFLLFVYAAFSGFVSVFVLNLGDKRGLELTRLGGTKPDLFGILINTACFREGVFKTPCDEQFLSALPFEGHNANCFSHSQMCASTEDALCCSSSRK
ncbi:hypothetical protein LguiA_015577 [Lonicera macranthoides]